MHRPISPRLRPVALAVVAVLLLGGCATGAEADDQVAAAVPLPEAEGATSYPLTLESPFGGTVLEERPERIAVVTPSTVDTDALLALGVVPVMAPSTVDRNPWLDPADVEHIELRWESEASAEVSAETVASVRPDLIVALYAAETFDQAVFDRMSSIAPVLYGSADELSWQEITRALGEPLDLADAADTAVTRAEDAVEAARAAHPEFAGRTAAHVIVYEQEYGAAYASAPGTDSARLFASLGFAEPAQAARFPPDGTVSDELVGLIDADFLLVSTFGEASDYFLESPLVQAVPAVADGRYAVTEADAVTGTNSFAWGLNVQSALSVPWLIDRLSAYATEVLG